MKVAILNLLISLVLFSPQAQAADLSADRIGEIVGVRATTAPNGVIRVGWPRKEVEVRVDGLPMRPFMGLGTWAAFQQSPADAMVMGDTVVFEDEVNPAIDAAFANGLEVTGLHNHFFYDQPKVYFMHIGGHGDAEKLAQGVKVVWDAVKKVRTANGQPAVRFSGDVPTHGNLDADSLSTIVGVKGSLEDQVYKITIGREAQMHGMKFGGSMGLTTWAAFAGTDELAAIDGDFAMTAAEVQAVLKALRGANINVVALHNHMIGESPAYYFVHFWGKGKARDLAAGFRAALDAQQQAAATDGKMAH